MTEEEIKKSDWLVLNGRHIRRFYAATPDGEVCIDNQRQGVSLVLRAENLGDHIEIWVAVLANGKEDARYAIRMINTIIWLKE
jgi:hypothetical protein